MLVSGKWITNGCRHRGFWQKHVVHNRTAIEFNQPNNRIVRIKPFVWLIGIWLALVPGRTRGSAPYIVGNDAFGWLDQTTKKALFGSNVLCGWLIFVRYEPKTICISSLHFRDTNGKTKQQKGIVWIKTFVLLIGMPLVMQHGQAWSQPYTVGTDIFVWFL